MGTFNVRVMLALRIDAASIEEARQLATARVNLDAGPCELVVQVTAESLDAMQLSQWRTALAERGHVVRECEVDKGHWRWSRYGPAHFESEADAIKALAVMEGLLEPIGACDDMRLRGKSIREWKQVLKAYDKTEVYQSTFDEGCWGYTDCQEETFATEFEAVKEALLLKSLLPFYMAA